VVPQMIERRGSITIISSIGGLKGSTVLGAYAIPKPQTCNSRGISLCEYGKHNIRVNCIAPGLIKTDFARALWENPETLKARQSARRSCVSASPMKSRAPRCFLRLPPHVHDGSDHRHSRGKRASSTP